MKKGRMWAEKCWLATVSIDGFVIYFMISSNINGDNRKLHFQWQLAILTPPQNPSTVLSDG